MLPADERLFEFLSLHRAGVAWRYALRVLQLAPRLLLATPIRALRAIADESTPLRDKVIAGAVGFLSATWVKFAVTASRDGANAMLSGFGSLILFRSAC
jgi:hypothetical protein